MRGIIAGVLTLAGLAGCGTTAPPPDPATDRAAHDRMVAGLDGLYIWDCTLTSEDGRPPWRFVLQRQGQGQWQDVVMLEAGEPPSGWVEVQKDKAARIYLMQDKSRFLVASDGEVRVEGQGAARSTDYDTGRCRKGGQPA